MIFSTLTYQRSTSCTASVEILGGYKDDVILSSKSGSVLDWLGLTISRFLIGFILIRRWHTDVLNVGVILGGVDTLLEKS